MSIYQSVQIGGTAYDSFASVEDADAYLMAEPGPEAAAWRDLDDPDVKGRNLVGATRIILRQSVRPELIADPLPQPLRDATILLAAAMASGYDAANQATTASSIKRQKAGSVEQEFFAPGVVAGSGGYRFPLPVWELIRGLLNGGGEDAGIGGSFSSGTCGRSITDIDYGCGAPSGYPDSDAYERAWG